jgi:peptidoglycan/LPS O-acetylase OafA/YrhL
VSTLDGGTFFSRPETWVYFFHNLFLQVELTLPGVFSAGQVNGAVNQPLWTLPYEIQMYILVCLLGWLLALPGTIALSAWRQCLYDTALILAFAWLLGNPKQGLFLPVVMDMLTLPMLASFAAGSMAFLLRDRIPLRLDLAVLLLLYLAIMPTTNTSRIAFLCGWWYLLLVFAFYPFPLLLRWSKTLDRHDFSYGMYLSGFPIQQTLIAYVTKEPWSLFGLSLACSLAWAAASWHCVEKPCLDLKRYLKHL